jgi:hypothetical protein
MEDSYFTSFIAQLKEDISEKKNRCTISYLSKEEEKSADLIESKKYFLWYLTDQGYKYNITKQMLNTKANDANVHVWKLKYWTYINIDLKKIEK